MADYTPNETGSQLFAEKMWLQGALITAVGYGAVLTLYVLAFYLLLSRLDRWNRQAHAIFLVYITVQFILATLFQASSARFTQLAFINNRDYPGGPGAYELAFFYIPVDMLGNIVYVLSNWFSDALLLWRCAVIYSTCRFPLWVIMGFPAVVMMGSVGSGIMYLLQVSTTSPFLPSSANFTIIDSSISLALNLMLTIMIVGRLVVYRYRLKTNFGLSVSQRDYTSVMAMLVESAGLYAAFSLFFIVPFALGSSVENIAFQALSQVQVIAPFLIIVRVSQGKAWSTSTALEITSASEGLGTLKDKVPMAQIQFACASGDDTSMPNAISHHPSVPNSDTTLTTEVV
ncbi:hypothetical protein GG344DRAFT_82074 [Lentinula edodes]|nr:hypothetical protein GG344DRAFT_82074 [Lentinula edodes]